MFYYSRQIIYLDFMENGHKVRNAGFLKLEEMEDGIRWNIRIKGLYEADSGFYEIRDETGAVVDKMLLEQGAGNYAREAARGMRTRGGRPWEEIGGVRIDLAHGRSLEGHWCSKAERSVPGPRGNASRDVAVSGQDLCGDIPAHEKKETGSERGQIKEKAKAAEGFLEAAGMEERGEARQPTECQRRRSEIGWQEQSGDPRDAFQKMTAKKETKGPGRAAAPPGPGKREKGGTGVLEEKRLPSRDELYEDKWQQLEHMYPTVHPFGDEREFLSITPKDFVILAREYQKMVHNSFLLHGYYNYRHIILGRMSHGGEDLFYLGVPGVYYDREIMAAEMFGFEAFEGKRMPAEQGSFGYYMKQVGI